MMFRGVVKNGVIVTPDVELPEGAVVDFTLRPKASKPRSQPIKSARVRAGKAAKTKSRSSGSPARKRPAKTLLDLFKGTVGKLKGLPPDMSVNHDHYLYGVPKSRP